MSRPAANATASAMTAVMTVATLMRSLPWGQHGGPKAAPSRGSEGVGGRGMGQHAPCYALCAPRCPVHCGARLALVSPVVFGGAAVGCGPRCSHAGTELAKAGRASEASPRFIYRTYLNQEGKTAMNITITLEQDGIRDWSCAAYVEGSPDVPEDGFLASAKSGYTSPREALLDCVARLQTFGWLDEV